jgi:hypothetical protein
MAAVVVAGRYAAVSFSMTASETSKFE